MPTNNVFISFLFLSRLCPKNCLNLLKLLQTVRVEKLPLTYLKFQTIMTIFEFLSIEILNISVSCIIQPNELDQNSHFRYPPVR